jgi:transcriptional regulator with XRE-family HTH domain
MDKNQELGKRLESLIKILNMKKGEFADKAGISQSLISNIIAGKNGASKATINLICVTYNVNKEWLINGQEPVFNEKPNFDRLGSSPIIGEIIYLYDKLLPEIQKEIREYIMEKYELQELRKLAALQPNNITISPKVEPPVLSTYPTDEKREQEDGAEKVIGTEG